MKLCSALLSACLASSFGAAATFGAEVDFAKEIKPIIEKVCLKCHGPEKPKGELRLDTKAGAFKGSKNGEVIVAGKADDSEFYKLLILPKDDAGRMPQEADPLPKAETDLIKEWINQGAKWPDGLALTVPKGASSVPVVPVDPGVAITDGEKAAVAQVQKLGALALRLAQNTNLLRVDFSLQGKELKDENLAALKDMPNLTELGLGGTPITDAGVAHLKPLTNLTRLKLDRTKVTDAGLANLKGMQKLSYLNLYGTEVTDAGLDHLKELKGLRKLYLWQSKVTEDGAKKLKAALPEVTVDLGIKPPPPEAKKEEKKDDAKKEEKKEEKKDAKKEEKKEEKKDEKKTDKKEEKKDEKKS